jgi:sodium transport system permease protein
MASPSQNLTPRLYHAVAVGPAIVVFAGAVATFLAIGMTLGGTGGLVAAQLLGLGGVTLASTWWLTGGVRALGVAPPRPLAAAGAILVGTTFWYANLRLAVPVADWLGGADELRAFQARYVDAQPIAPTLVVLALVPGVAEELLCRGLLVRAFAARLPAWLALVLSAAAFSALHLSLPRALPTFTLGLVLGWVALASGSVWTAVLVHATNNAMAIAVTLGAVDPLAGFIGAYPSLALALSVAGTAAGLAVLAISSAQRNQRDTSP